MEFEWEYSSFNYEKCREQSRNPYDVNLSKHTDEIVVAC